MACSPAQRKIDLKQYEDDLRHLWRTLGMSPETTERAIEMTKRDITVSRPSGARHSSEELSS